MKIPTLQTWLENAAADERFDLASTAATTVNYLYQLAGGHRRASAELAIKIETAARAVRAKNGKLRTLRRVALAPHINWRRLAPRK